MQHRWNFVAAELLILSPHTLIRSVRSVCIALSWVSVGRRPDATWGLKRRADEQGGVGCFFTLAENNGEYCSSGKQGQYDKFVERLLFTAVLNFCKASENGCRRKPVTIRKKKGFEKKRGNTFVWCMFSSVVFSLSVSQSLQRVVMILSLVQMSNFSSVIVSERSHTPRSAFWQNRTRCKRNNKRYSASFIH